MTIATSESHGLDVLLTHFLAGQSSARDKLPVEVGQLLLQLALRHGRGLAPEVLPEVVNQVFMNLLNLKPSAFDATRGTAKTFLELRVREASRQVRASYTAPGRPTRQRKRRRAVRATAQTSPADPGRPQSHTPPPEEAGPWATPLSLEELSEAEQPLSGTTVSAMEARCDGRVLLERAEPELAWTLWRIIVLEESIQEIADEQQVSRSTLSRRLSAFMEQVQEWLILEQRCASEGWSESSDSVAPLL